MKIHPGVLTRLFKSLRDRLFCGKKEFPLAELRVFSISTIHIQKQPKQHTQGQGNPK